MAESKSRIFAEGPGILLPLFIAGIAWFGAAYTPSWLNAILLSLLLGIAWGNTLGVPDRLDDGIILTANRMLELSVLFLAFSISFAHIQHIGWLTFAYLAMVVLLVLWITARLSSHRLFPGAGGWLIGFGTAICGSSAIAALSPIAAREKEDIGIAIAVTNLFGTLGMLLFPLLLPFTGWDPQQMAMIIGGTLHSVGNVAGSGYTLSDAVGASALTVKMARVALLSPGLLLMSYLLHRSRSQETQTAATPFSFSLPWYLWSFIGITVLGSLIPFPQSVISVTEELGKAVLTLAMAAIGLKIGFRMLWQTGRQGLLFGLFIFILQILLILPALWLMR